MEDSPTEKLQLSGRDGLSLVGDQRGDPGAPSVVFLHGGGQTRHSWSGAAKVVAGSGWRAITLDARGHGESAWSGNGDYRMTTLADDVRLVLDQLDIRPVLVGASLGGLTSIVLTGEVAPGLASGVVLVDIIPQIEPAGAKRIQSFMADRAQTGFASLEEVADAIAAYNPHRPRPTDLSGLSKNVRERDGRFYWHWDPAFMGGSAGAADLSAREVYDLDRLERAVERMVADVPVMLVRGKASDLVSEAGAAAFCSRHPDVEFVDVSGAGHMVAGDRNDAFTSAVVDFLERHLPR